MANIPTLKSVMKMEFNEVVILNINHYEEVKIRRVPGGWVYTISAKKPGYPDILDSSSCFIPYSEDTARDFQRSLGNE